MLQQFSNCYDMNASLFTDATAQLVLADMATVAKEVSHRQGSKCARCTWNPRILPGSLFQEQIFRIRMKDVFP